MLPLALRCGVEMHARQMAGFCVTLCSCLSPFAQHTTVVKCLQIQMKTSIITTHLTVIVLQSVAVQRDRQEADREGMGGG